MRHLKSSQISSVHSDLLDQVSPSLKRSVELASEKVLQVGSLFFLGKNMVLLYTRLVSMMPLLLNMAGILLA